MKIWIQPFGTLYSTLHAMDDQARLWMREQFPADRNQYHGDGLTVPQENVPGMENKFVDAGGQLI